MNLHAVARGSAPRLIRPAIALLLALAAGPAAHAVSAITVDGHPSPVTLTAGETITIRFDVAKAGGTVQWRLVRDLARAGKFDPNFPQNAFNPITDGTGQDADPAPGKIGLVWPLFAPTGLYLFQLEDNSDGSTLTAPFWTIVPKSEPQAISGRVLISAGSAAGSPPADAVIWAYSNPQTSVASASIRADGSYTLPLPPGTYILFAEWFGSLRSQRQVVNLAAGQQQSGVDLPLLQGQEVAGNVRSDAGQPMADTIVQATAANGKTVAARTFSDGSFVIVLPNGDYTLTARGLSRGVSVADGPADGVDFPTPAPGPAPVNGTIVTVAGNGTQGFGGDRGPALSARMSAPQGIALDAAGNFYIADLATQRIRKVDAKTGVITTVAGSSPIEIIRGLTPLGTGGFGGDGGPATAAQLWSAQHVTVDTAGNLYIPCTRNNRVRKVDAGTGIITTVAGSGPIGLGLGSFSGDNGPATAATLSSPQGVAVDAAGNLFIVDGRNKRVRKVAPNGIITTVVGGGKQPLADGVKATELDWTPGAPRGIAIDGAGNLYLGDNGLARILKVSPAGIVTIYAGTGKGGFSGDGGPATQAQLLNPGQGNMAVDRAGSLYFADASNHRIRKISPEGIITTIAGNGPSGLGSVGSFGGDGGPATEARLWAPVAVAIDAAGNLLVCEQGNRRIRKIIGIAAPGLVGGR